MAYEYKRDESVTMTLALKKQCACETKEVQPIPYLEKIPGSPMGDYFQHQTIKGYCCAWCQTPYCFDEECPPAIS